MAQKHDTHPPSTSSARVSPPLTPSDRLLFSTISLPPNARIAYASFTPPADDPPHDLHLLEIGRRQLVSRNDSLALLESILPHVHIDATSSVLHAFMFTSVDHSDACLSTLGAISVNGLASECTLDPLQLVAVLLCICNVLYSVTHSAPSFGHFILRSPRSLSLFTRVYSTAVLFLLL